MRSSRKWSEIIWLPKWSLKKIPNEFTTISILTWRGKKYGRVTVKLSYKNWFIHCPKIIFLLFIIFMAWASKFFSFICRILSGLSLKKYTSQYSILSILLSCITFHYITRFVRTKLTKSYIVSETFLPTTCPQLPPPCIRPLLWTRTHFFQSKSIISHSK